MKHLFYTLLVLIVLAGLAFGARTLFGDLILSTVVSKASAARVGSPGDPAYPEYPVQSVPPTPRTPAITDASTTEMILEAATRSLIHSFEATSTVAASTTAKKPATPLSIFKSIIAPILPKPPPMSTTTIRIGQSISISAWVAKTAAEQELGLGERDSLPADQGMLFVFPVSASYGFWMKDMRFPIDMIWVNSAKKVVSISAGARPDSYPKVFRPASPVKYVLEVNSGAAKRLDITTGSLLKF